jgi:hypothetical protein
MDRTHDATAAATQLKDIYHQQKMQPEHGKAGHHVHNYNQSRFTFEADRVARWHNVSTEQVLSEYHRLGYAA